MTELNYRLGHPDVTITGANPKVPSAPAKTYDGWAIVTKTGEISYVTAEPSEDYVWHGYIHEHDLSDECIDLAKKRGYRARRVKIIVEEEA